MTFNGSAGSIAADFPYLDFPQPRREEINDDLDFLVYEDPSRSVITVDIIWRSGFRYHKKGSIPYMMSKMLMRGSKNRNAIGIANALEQYGAQLTIDAEQDIIGIHMKILAHDLDATLPLLTEILNTPTFLDKELVTLKEIVKSEVAQQHASPSFTAQEALRKAIFGRHHPYAYTPTEGDIDRVTTQELKRYYLDYRWNRPYIIITGNITSQRSRLIKKVLAGHIPITHQEVTAPDLQPGDQQQRIIHSNSKQSSVMMGQPTILYNHTDYADLFIANVLLGGFFGSRLMQTLREKKGYTYGIYSHMVPWEQNTYWCIATEVTQSATEEAIDAIKTEIIGLQSQLANKKEMELLRNYVLGRLLANFDSIFSLAKFYWTTCTHSMDMHYYQHLYERAKSITPERICEVAKLYFHVDKLHEVVVTSSH
ncbi:MAG: pitrilysin family protein [Bacteroidota bacterium]